MSLKDVLGVSLTPGEVALVWLNSYSSIAVKTVGATLIFDPVRIELGEQVRADAIIITHEHPDHFDARLLAECQQKLGIPIIASTFVAQMLPREAKALRVGDSVSVGDIELLAERCDHPANEPLSFVISARDAPTIYHPSDSQPFAEMAELRDKYRPDILVYSGASVEEAIQMVRLVQPQVTVSFYHDRNWAEMFLRRVNGELPGTQIRLVKRLEVWRYRRLQAPDCC